MMMTDAELRSGLRTMRYVSALRTLLKTIENDLLHDKGSWEPTKRRMREEIAALKYAIRRIE